MSNCFGCLLSLKTLAPQPDILKISFLRFPSLIYRLYSNCLSMVPPVMLKFPSTKTDCRYNTLLVVANPLTYFHSSRWIQFNFSWQLSQHGWFQWHKFLSGLSFHKVKILFKKISANHIFSWMKNHIIIRLNGASYKILLFSNKWKGGCLRNFKIYIFFF